MGDHKKWGMFHFWGALKGGKATTRGGEPAQYSARADQYSAAAQYSASTVPEHNTVPAQYSARQRRALGLRRLLRAVKATQEAKRKKL